MLLKKTAAAAFCVMLLSAQMPVSAADMTWSYDEESATVSVKGYGMINDATQLKQYLDRAKRINVLGGVTKIDRNVFTDCGNVEEVILPDGFLSVGDNSFSMSKSLKTINFPDTLESIGNEAFMGCSSLESVTIPKSVSSIGKNAFGECVKVREFKVSEENSIYSEIDGIIFSKDGTELILYPPGMEAESYAVPENVTKIHNSAFAYNPYITEITFPDSTAEIDDYAFYFCDRLKSVSFGSGLKKIGNYSFYGAKPKSVKLPYGTEYIGNNAFKNCEKLITADIPGTVTFIGENAFYGTNKELFIRGYGDTVKKYADAESKNYYNSVRVQLDGKELEFDQPAIIDNDYTMVPMRKIFEALGAVVEWDNSTKTAYGKKDGITCSIKIGDSKLYKNSETIELAAPAKIINGKTLVHIRAIAEAFGARVDWDSGTGLVTIASNN